MKPPPFVHLAPSSVEEAARALASWNRDGRTGLVLAGGQAVVPALSARRIRPDALVDIARIPGLDGIRVDEDGTLRLGPAARLADLAAHPEARAGWTALAQAAEAVGTPQLRSRATAGGNLLVHLPAGELPTVLLALDASVTLVDIEGSRGAPVAAILDHPSGSRVGPGAILTEILVPPQAGPTGFAELAQRAAGAPLAAACAAVRRDTARVVVTGLGPRPWDAVLPLEPLLRGREDAAAALAAAAGALAGEEAVGIAADLAHRAARAAGGRR